MAEQTEFEKATDFEFKEEDIELAKASVGRLAPGTSREHLTTASYDGIRNFARSYGDDNPLFASETYGETTRWGGQIAPPMIAIALNSPLLADPPKEKLKRPSFRGIHVFVSGTTWDWFRPVMQGDRLYTISGMYSVVEKRSEFSGRSLHNTSQGIKINQRGEIVAITRTLAIHTERKKARETGKYNDLKPATYTDEDLAKYDAIYAEEGPRGSETRYWEDVQVGESLKPMAKGPLTTTDIIVFHSGGYGFQPYEPCSNRVMYKNKNRIGPFYVKNEYGIPDVAQRVHWDSSWAQAIGNPMAYDYGVMRDCWLSHFITDWMGDDAWLMSQHSEIRKFNYMGDIHVITGEVVGKRIEDGRYLVDIEMRGTNQRDVVTCPATATVALPSREGGAVVLPQPPADLQEKAYEYIKRHNELVAERRAAGKH